MPVGPLWTPKSSTPGAIWCAQRIPDDHVSVCPNESRIGEIDLDNPDYFLASLNVISFAEKKGYYDPKSGVPFNWKKAYSPSEYSVNSSRGTRARMWRFFDLAAPFQKISPDTPNMELPFSVKPDKNLSVKDIMNLTRDKYQGTKFDPAAGLRGGPFNNPNYHPRLNSSLNPPQVPNRILSRISTKPQMATNQISHIIPRTTLGTTYSPSNSPTNPPINSQKITNGSKNYSQNRSQNNCQRTKFPGTFSRIFPSKSCANHEWIET